MATSKFHHEEIYRGKDLIAKLSKFNIFVCGAGTVGSNLIDTMSRQGFSKISVIDMDRVESHNINTQVFGEMDVGALKAAALKNKVFRNTGVDIEAISKKLEPSTLKVLKSANIVVDCFDNSASRQLVQDECRKKKIACIHAGLFEDYGEVIWDENYKVPGDMSGDICDYPLTRNLAMLVVTILSEELIDFCLKDKPRKYNWSVTLKDLAIRRLSV